MIIRPKIRGFVCTTAHPLGCEQAVREQITYVQRHARITTGPRKVLVIGASTGYGLASRIVAAFGSGAKTIGVAFEREAANRRTASPGWYNTIAFEKLACKSGLYSKSINGDAFSDAIKEQVAELIEKELGQVDLVIYSLAAPQRMHPKTGKLFNSTLKTVGQNYSSKTVDPISGNLKNITIDVASQEEIQNTTAVMGGEDWEMWIDILLQKKLLAHGAMSIAYTYIGPSITHPIYKNGTIGIAKKHLHETAIILDDKLKQIDGKAFLSVNKALVTQASAAIPVVPLYISLLFKVMKEKNMHEGCIEQIYRLFKDKVFREKGQLHIDKDQIIHMDDWEMDEEVQQEIERLWPLVTIENLEELTDLHGYRDDFYKLFGFNFDEIDYKADVEV